MRTIHLVLAGFGALISLTAPVNAQQWQPQSFTPIPNVIKPFGYGTVFQYLAGPGYNTGTSICASHNRALQCMSVSGNNSCSQPVPAGELVSCGSSANPPVNQAPFAPVDCNGYGEWDGGKSGELGITDWCLIASYMTQRAVDTVYQFDDYVRLGVNRRFGGTIFELYGADKIDRILQNAGGAVQLSLWAFTTGYAPQNLNRDYFAVSSTSNGNWRGNCNATPYTTYAECVAANPGLNCQQGVDGPNLASCPTVYPCAPNGAGAGAPFNPIQGQSPTCDWGLQQGAIDSISSPGPGQIMVSKSNPANFTRSDTFNLTWTQISQVTGPYAKVIYHMNDTLNQQDTDFQEIPAIFTHQGLGANIYYYGGNHPYNDVNGPVSFVNDQAAGVNALELPGRPGPFGTGAIANLTEDWVSSCDITGKKCITVASFSSAAQDVITSFSSDSSYLGIHGYFSITQNLNKTVTLFMFPYRFDDVIMGMSVRAWIYQLYKNPMYHQ